MSKNQLYECNISTTPTGLLIQPTAKTTVTLVDKGGGEWLYSEWGADIRDIFDSQPDGPEPVAAQKYVLSARERQQAGRIIKVYDTDHLYTFECTNVERVHRPMVRAKYSNRRPIKRETVLKFERKLNECPGRTLGTKDTDGNIITKTYPYEPLELE